MIRIEETVVRKDILKSAEKNRKSKSKRITVKIQEPKSSLRATFNRWFVEDDYMVISAIACDRSSGSGNWHNVHIAFKGVMKNLLYIVERDRHHYVTRDTVRKAISRTFTRNTPLSFGCSCEDFTYRYRYYATASNSVIGSHETRRPKVTNPDDNIGYQCKHLLALTKNKDLLRGVVVTQALKYIEKNYDAILDKYNLDKSEFVFVNRKDGRH